jgi:hypothetical protein
VTLPGRASNSPGLNVFQCFGDLPLHAAFVGEIRQMPQKLQGSGRVIRPGREGFRSCECNADDRKNISDFALAESVNTD